MRNIEDIVIDIRHKIYDMRNRAECISCKKESCDSYNFCLGIAEDYEQIANCLEELVVYRENYSYNDLEVITLENTAFKNGQRDILDTLLKYSIIDKSVLKKLQVQVCESSECELSVIKEEYKGGIRYEC